MTTPQGDTLSHPLLTLDPGNIWTCSSQELWEYSIYSPENQLVQLHQDGASLENYVWGFVEASALVNWDEPIINHLFLFGLDDDLLALIIGFPKSNSSELLLPGG